MPSSKLLKERIESIQDTMKITNAMYLISSSKLRKARKNYQNVSPYFNRMRDTISRVVPHLPEEPVHPFFHERNIANPKRAYIVLTADKGMAGAYNQNIIKFLKENADENDRFYVIGQTGYRALYHKDPRLVEDFHYGATEPTLQRARDITMDAIDDFKTGKLDEIYRIADRLTILRNGAYVSSGPISEYDQARFTRDMTGHDVSDEKYHPAENAEEILRVEHLTRKGAFEDVSFTLNRGDVLGLTGLLGSGRGEIGQALFGLTPAESGRIVLNGKEITIKSVNDAMANDIGYVPEDRLTQGLFMDRSIQDNTVASSIRKYMKGGKLDEQAMETVTRRWIDEINIVAPSPKPAVRTLSGGNAQKVVIAKWLNTDPKLFILDGPTVGVDIGAKAEIHAILRDLAQKGIGIIVISDDLPELVQNCNKIIVMRDGKVEAAVDNSIDELSLSNLLIGASDAAKSAAQTTEQEVEEK